MLDGTAMVNLSYPILDPDGGDLKLTQPMMHDAINDSLSKGHREKSGIYLYNAKGPIYAYILISRVQNFLWSVLTCHLGPFFTAHLY